MPSSDLAEWTERPQPDVAAVLDRLCRGESGRILRALSPTSAEEAERDELLHDVLAEPVLEWRRGYEQRRDRRVALRRYARIVGARSGVMVVSPDSPAETSIYTDPTVTSQLGFNRVVARDGEIWASHGEAGVVGW